MICQIVIATVLEKSNSVNYLIGFVTLVGSRGRAALHKSLTVAGQESYNGWARACE